MHDLAVTTPHPAPGPTPEQVRRAVEDHCRRAHEAAVQMRNEGTFSPGPDAHDTGDRHVVVDSIEIWTVRADGRVSAVRAYFEPDPSVNTDYFVPTELRG